MRRLTLEAEPISRGILVACQYQPKRFFREVPNRLLKEYFQRRGVLASVPFDELRETQIDPIYQAWLDLTNDQRNELEQDFQEIDELATEAGSKAILDEARWHGEDLAKQFASLNGFQEHAFWTFLQRPRYWRGALAFNHADTVSSRFWRKRKNLPRRPACVDAASIEQLEKEISHYFHSEQGRGQNCKVDCFRRNELDYFFAYPEDYAQARVEWEGTDIARPARHPAFEIIVVYSQEAGTLDTFLPGDRDCVKDLQAIFAETILQSKLGPDAKDEQVYELDPLRSRDFVFVFNPESGIVDVRVTKLRLKVIGKNERMVLEANPDFSRYAVFDLLDKITRVIPLSQVTVTLVGIRVTFTNNPHSNRPRRKTFEVASPCSCSLKHSERDLKIRKMLIDSGIEPRLRSTVTQAP